MPRPRKNRKVCRLPKHTEFKPVGLEDDEIDPVIMTVDEYETIRLIDSEGFSQEECGNYMDIARSTVQQIYTEARKKLALALVNGRPLVIRGGAYQLCDREKPPATCGSCHRHRRGKHLGTPK